MYKITTDLQSFFERRLPHFLQGYISHPYKTRNASTRILDISTAPTAASSVTTSVSSMDNSSVNSVKDRYRGRRRRGVRDRLHRKTRRKISNVTGRGRKRTMEISNNDSASSGSEEDGHDDDGDGQGSTRSVSVSSSYNNNNHHHHLEGVPVIRRQTRSMRKDVSLPSPGADEERLADKERFSMTLRVRSQLRRKRFYESEEGDGDDEEEEELKKEEESMDGASEEESVGKRQTTRKGRPPFVKQEQVREESTRSLRKRPKRTKYFDDENDYV